MYNARILHVASMYKPQLISHGRTVYLYLMNVSYYDFLAKVVNVSQYTVQAY